MKTLIEINDQGNKTFLAIANYIEMNVDVNPDPHQQERETNGEAVFDWTFPQFSKHGG